MENEIETTDDQKSHEMFDKIAVTVLATAAGFLTQKLVEHLYDGVVTRFRARKSTEIAVVE